MTENINLPELIWPTVRCGEYAGPPGEGASENLWNYDAVREAQRAAVLADRAQRHQDAEYFYEMRLRAVSAIINDHLPPDGIPADVAVGLIIGLVDPWPVPSATYGAQRQAVPPDEPGSAGKALAIREHLERQLAEMTARKDDAYEERNKVVAALAKVFPSGVARTAIEGWSEDWHGCVYIDLPTGQVSWHFHDSQAHLFADLPPYAGEWDGHDTPEKYRRVAALRQAVPQGETVSVPRKLAERIVGLLAQECAPCADPACRITDKPEKAITECREQLWATLSASPTPPASTEAQIPTAEPIGNFTLPAIGQPWPGIDGIYAGISRGEDGEPDGHMVLLNAQPEDDMSWDAAVEWTQGLGDGARLPTRFESALLYANVRDKLDTSCWHWTGTQYSSYYAWYQYFDYGDQYYYGKKAELRARAVRRLNAQSFNPSDRQTPAANTKPASEPVQDAASIEGLMKLVSLYGRYKSELCHSAAVETCKDIRDYAQRLKEGK